MRLRNLKIYSQKAGDEESQYTILVSKLVHLRLKRSECFSFSLKVDTKIDVSAWADRQGEHPFICGLLSLFVLLRPFTDWMRQTPIREGDLLYLLSLLIEMLASSKNTFIDICRTFADQISGHSMASQVDVKLTITWSVAKWNFVKYAITIQNFLLSNSTYLYFEV